MNSERKAPCPLFPGETCSESDCPLYGLSINALHLILNLSANAPNPITPEKLLKNLKESRQFPEKYKQILEENGIEPLCHYQNKQDPLP